MVPINFYIFSYFQLKQYTRCKGFVLKDKCIVEGYLLPDEHVHMIRMLTDSDLHYKFTNTWP